MTPTPADYVRRNKHGVYEYYRRVPLAVAEKFGRPFIKTSLKTKDPRAALDKAAAVHTAAQEAFAAIDAGNDNETPMAQYTAAVRAAQSLGFGYKPASEAASGPDAAARIMAAIEAEPRSTAAFRGVLGIAPDPSPRLSEILKAYERHNAAGLTGMSPRQVHKHLLSRKRALTYAQGVLGDAKVSEITRADVLRFKEWWESKIADGGLKAYSANRCLSDIKGMLAVIDTALQTDYRAPWNAARVKETNANRLNKRSPFPPEWVQTRILAPDALSALNEDARFVVYVMAETGARLGEVCNLRPEDVSLDDPVPFIEIADRADRRQKTTHSIRRIPLVGVALWAMRQRPAGFPRYRDKADSASATINKTMRAAGLMPTDRHTIYSLRHTFQDRIENAGASDRMQADLMGHEFGRPTYGDGAALERRRDFLESIKFAVRWA